MDDFDGQRNDDSRNDDSDMRTSQSWIIAGLMLIVPTASSAQLLPGVQQAVPDLIGRAGDTLDGAGLDRLSPARLADRLAAVRAARIDTMLRNHGDRIELDDRREPARRGVILLTGVDGGMIDTLRAAGYGVDSMMIEGLDLPVTRLTTHKGRSLAKALRDVRRLAPRAQVSADNLYFPSGPALPLTTGTLAAGRIEGRAAGLIDGGVARHPALTGPIEQRGFAEGAPRASAHGTAVASLISGDGVVKGASPGAPLLVADVYGADPAGGGAFALVRALGWMAARGVPVVTVSLVGPANPLLDGAIRLARDKGVMVVAAVGNDGPAAPPAYPASYPGVIAVTGIDGRGRLLPEAGRALHVDFAAPGADMQAGTVNGGKGPVRGTSFAAPLVAGRLFARGSIAALRAEATRGKPPVLCADCRNKD
ncbi:S8 family serine peptidase [Sphingobium sp. HBC34]|uniref:S8 family serine peptidase n=1 Tax=Sphingobium cyanobacteriorum TaxID=3063954 RepID=A0ABT8ZKK9_9SPHN|nr:S8 family serine peptidase [Sphingobium sp. HBC34]MDO7835063.1 S8 family serine peptidase [Sphingobium sp. HBC34]